MDQFLVYYDDNFNEAELKKRFNLQDDRIIVRYDSSVLVKLSDEEEAELIADNIIIEKVHDKNTFSLATSENAPKSSIDFSLLQTDKDTEKVPVVWIVQFVGPIKKEWLQELEKMNIQTGGFVDPYGVFIYANHQVVDQLKRIKIGDDEPVEWIARYDKELKRKKILPSESNQWERVNISIDYFPWATDLQKETIFVENETLENIEKIIESEAVQYVEIKLTPKLFNAEARTVLETKTLHDNNLTGGNQVIAITDTGIHRAHETFASTGKISSIIKFTGDSFNGGGDGAGHGTHVAASAAGDSEPFSTWNKEDGQGFGSKLVDVKVFTNSGTWAPRATEYTIWNNAYQNGARINNNSWGSESRGTYTTTDRDADRICSEKSDYVLVVAGGNSGNASRTIGSPGVAKNVLTVGASGSTGTTSDDVAQFSSRGPTSDNRIKPDVLAPGVSIVSAKTFTRNEYISYNGTSMATPQVSGVASLIRQYFQMGWYPTGAPVSANSLNPSAALIRAMIINGAEEVNGLESDRQLERRYPNNSQGWGRVNVKRTLPIATDPTRRRVILWDVVAAPATGARWSAGFNISNTVSEVKVTLVWTDAPASAGATVTLVNNLHLRVRAPNGQYYLGNNFTGINPGYSVVGGIFDNSNPIEAVHLLANFSFGANTAIPNGDYQIEVISSNQTSVNKGFALVVGISNISAPPVPPSQIRVAVMGDYNSQLTTLLKGAGYLVDTYVGNNYSELIANINQYKSIILNKLSDTTGFDTLLQSVPVSTGIVFLGSYPVTNSALGILSRRRTDPTRLQQQWAQGPVKMRVTVDHPVFIGNTVNDEVMLINGGDNDYQTYEILKSGQTIGANAMPAGYPSMVGIREETATSSRQVLLANMGPQSYTNTTHWTDKGKALLLNSVSWSATGLG